MTTSGTRTGATRNSAPASIAFFRVPGMSITVPQPTITLPSYLARKSETASRQPGAVSLNSTISKPPSMAACIAGGHCSPSACEAPAHARYFLKVSRTVQSERANKRIRHERTEEEA